MSTTPKHRNSELAKIHIAKKQLELDDETYRSMLWTVARVTSSKDLDQGGRRALLAHLRARGFKDQKPARKTSGRPRNIDNSAQLGKVEAMLADAGRPWAYADGMAARMFHVDRVAWCNADQLQRIIAALVYDQKRRSVTATENEHIPGSTRSHSHNPPHSETALPSRAAHCIAIQDFNCTDAVGSDTESIR